MENPVRIVANTMNDNGFIPPELYRFKDAPMGYASSFGDRFGIFDIPVPNSAGAVLRCIASDGELSGWEHVSVVRWFGKKSMTPIWDDMALVKDKFWTPETCVYQLHPPQSEYVNNHPNCLHLWRKVGFEMPLPNSILVGIK